MAETASKTAGSVSSTAESVSLTVEAERSRAEAAPTEGVTAVYAFVENSGRLDQIMANIQSLFKGRSYHMNSVVIGPYLPTY